MQNKILAIGCSSLLQEQNHIHKCKQISFFFLKKLRNNCHVTLVSGVQHNASIFVYIVK